MLPPPPAHFHVHPTTILGLHFSALPSHRHIHAPSFILENKPDNFFLTNFISHPSRRSVSPLTALLPARSLRPPGRWGHRITAFPGQGGPETQASSRTPEGKQQCRIQALFAGAADLRAVPRGPQPTGRDEG